MSLTLCVVSLCLEGVQSFLPTLQISNSYLPYISQMQLYKKNTNFPSIQQMFINGTDTGVHAENAAVNKTDVVPVLIEYIIHLGNRYQLNEKSHQIVLRAIVGK